MPSSGGEVLEISGKSSVRRYLRPKSTFVEAYYPAVDVMRLDKAYTDEQQLRDDLENMLNAKIRRLQVQRVDLVNNSCVVDVRFTINDTSTDAK